MEGKCPMCGAPVEDGRCGYCGYAVPAPVRTPECKNPAFHPTGNTQEEKSTTNAAITNIQIVNTPIMDHAEITPGVSRKSKTVALLLCIFLGVFGAHKFYVGKAGMGILYLFTMGLFGIGWFVDIILIATGSFRDEFDLPLKQ